MFTKRLLSVVGFLFLGASVRAAGIKSCTDAGVKITNDCTALPGAVIDNICIDGNTIYQYEDASKTTCYVSKDLTLNEGIHVLTVEGTTVTEVDISSVNDKENTNYLLYVCDNSKCELTNGFVKGENNTYFKILIGATAGVDASTSLVASDEANCEAGTIFKDKGDSDKIKYCIKTGHGEALGETKNYIVSIGGELNEGITVEGDTDMVVQVSNDAFVLNTVYTDEEYCVYATNEIQDRVSNFCTGTILDNMYTCTKGLCKKSASPIGVGKYIVESGGNYELYNCVNDSSGATRSCMVDSVDADNGILLAKEQDNANEYTFQKVEDINAVDFYTDTLFVYDCVMGICKKAEALIKFDEYSGYCNGSSKCASGGANTIILANIGTVSYTSKFIMTPNEGAVVDIKNGENYAFAGSSGDFAVLKNVDDVIVAKAKILDETVYVNISDKTLSNLEGFENCVPDGSIKKYTSVNTESNTATAGDVCVQIIECELSATSEDNLHCTEGYYLKNESSGKLVEDDKESGVLYHCNEYNECTSELSSGFKPGYYRNVDTINKNIQYFKCPAFNLCEAVAVTENLCSEVKVGGLITNKGENEIISICIDDNVSNAIALTDENAKSGVKVFISIDTKDGAGADAFGGKNASSYVLLDIGVNCLKNDSDDFKYRYADTDQKLIKRNDPYKSTICSNKNNMKEFKKGDNNIYTKTK